MSRGFSIAVAVPTIVPHGLLNDCVASVLAQHGVRPDLLIIENGPRVGLVCDYWEQHGASVYRPGCNLGVAASWNHACRWAWVRGHIAVVLLNDDLKLCDPFTLECLYACAANQPRRLEFLAGRGFGAACISRAVWDEVGEFDEGFWPGYFEDNDMHYRSKLLDIPWGEIDAPSQHWGSASIRSDPALAALNQLAFPLNQQRYAAKWGGSPHAERYRIAWNGVAPWASVRDVLGR